MMVSSLSKGIIDRRTLLVVLSAAILTPQTLFAQSNKPPAVVGWLYPGSAKSNPDRIVAFREGMAALGWREGPQFVIEERWADARMDRMQALAEELAAKKPAVIVSTGTSSVVLLAKVAPRVPIVQANGSGDLIARGLVASLARPGGMVTGLTNISSDIAGKSVELLMEMLPKARRVGMLVDPKTTGAQRDAVLSAFARYSVKLLVANVSRLEEIEPAIARLVEEGAQALFIPAAAWLTDDMQNILRLARAQRLPVVGHDRQWAEEGALLSHGTSRAAQYRRAAFYVDRILKGTKPGDLPIEQPMIFELVINMKTAKALGITTPQTILVRADRMIE